MDQDAEPALPAAARRLVELFQLGADERRVLALLLAAPEPLRLGQVALRLGLELTVLLTMLAGNGRLRVHGLVEVEPAAELGFLRPADILYAARGLQLLAHAALADADLFAGQAPGITYLAAPPPGTEWAKDLLQQDRALTPGTQVPQVVELVRERLIAPHPVLLWLSQCAAETVAPLGQAVRLRLSRPVLIIDGAALAGWPQPQLTATLRRLRRDADLRGAAVLVAEAQLLGGGWLALAAPRPPGQTAPVVLCGSGALSASTLPPAGSGAELVPQAATLRAAPTAAATAGAAGAAAEPAAEDPATLASRDDARRRAAMDAARAMGKPIPPELLAAAPPPAAPAPAAPPRPAAPAPAAAPASPPPPAAPAPAGPPRPTNPRLAAALAKAGLPPAGSTVQRSAPPAAASAAVESRPAAAPTPPPAAATPAAATEVPTEVPAELQADDQPPLPLADDAGLDELIRVARTTPNQAQRAELLRKLAGKKVPQVIQLFRANAQSPHPAVRAAAEDGMASLFGSTWNRTRAIPPPVQPPRSDDGNRGPGGAF